VESSVRSDSIVSQLTDDDERRVELLLASKDDTSVPTPFEMPEEAMKRIATINERLQELLASTPWDARSMVSSSVPPDTARSDFSMASDLALSRIDHALVALHTTERKATPEEIQQLIQQCRIQQQVDTGEQETTSQ